MVKTLHSHYSAKSAVMAQSEELLLSNVRDGDRQAFEYFYDKHKYEIYSFALDLTGRNKQDAEDVTGHAFTMLWIKRSTLTDPEHLLNFLYMAARNKVYNLLLKAKREARKSQRYRSFLQAWNDNKGSDYEKILAIFIRHVTNDVELLPERTKQVFLRFVIEGKAKGEVASQLGISEKTVYNEKLKAFEFLRTSLLRKGFDFSLLPLTTLLSLFYILI